MIIDSSAIVAMMRDENDAAQISEALRAASHPKISAATALETSIVVGVNAHQALDQLIEAAGVDVVPFSLAHAHSARQAYLRFGKGSGSPARLNFGDCISYALAKVTDEPLLFKGDDFTHTDIASALKP